MPGGTIHTPGGLDMDITFNCDKCGQEIVTEESGVGLQVECPNCAASIIVPSLNARNGEKRLKLKPHAEDSSNRLTPNTNYISPQPQAGPKPFGILPKLLTVLAIIAIGYFGGKFVADKFPKNQLKIESASHSVEKPKQETFDFFSSELEAKADGIYTEFEKAVHSRDVGMAMSLQRSVTGVFTNKTQAEQFWCKKIPLGAQRTLILAYLCPDCGDGICPGCGGKQVCKKCDGGKQCVLCSGKGTFISNCIRCKCSLCRGNGICSTCRGNKTFKCPTCNGDGQVVGKPRRQTCEHCGGTGQTKGLITSGLPSCPYCNSKGYIELKTMVQCSTCGGTGNVNCSRCNGTGRCSSCQGHGRDANCVLCRGTGVIRRECRDCSGSGVCANCKGTGVCPKCAGNGKCRTCEASGLAKSGTLLVNVGWIKQDTGYAAYTNSTLIPASAIGDQSAQYFGRTLSFHISEHELWCISETNDFTFVKSEIIR